MSEAPAHEQRSVGIAGTATVARAAAIRDQLAAATLDAHDLAVDLDVSDIDVTLIQLLVAARRSMGERGGSLHLAHPPGSALLEALMQGGFLHHAQANPLWTVEVTQ